MLIFLYILLTQILYQQVSFHLSKIFQIFAFHILSNNSYTKTFSLPEFLKQYILICCTRFVMISHSKVTFIHALYILPCFVYTLILPISYSKHVSIRATTLIYLICTCRDDNGRIFSGTYFALPLMGQI